MKVTYQSGKYNVEVEGGIKEIFEQLATFDSVFGNAKNKANGSENIGYRVREVDGNKYYEMYDRDTYHTLKFGQTKKDGSLFPRRKDADGNWLDDGGWTLYNPDAPNVKQTKQENAQADQDIPF